MVCLAPYFFLPACIETQSKEILLFLLLIVAYLSYLALNLVDKIGLVHFVSDGKNLSMATQPGILVGI